MNGFTNQDIRFDVLRRRAYNLRWAEQREGVIPLTAADHDFPASAEVVQALQAYIADGYFSYTPNRGLPEFREAAAKALREQKREPVDPALILPIDGAARGMSVIAKAFLSPGDEVIVFDPVDFLFRTTMQAAGAKVVLFPTKLREDRISLEGLEDYITPRTKMLGLCNPHNPMGMLYSAEDLQYLLDLSEKYGFYIMNDEIWSGIVYPGERFRSINEFGAERNARTLSVYGFSKDYGLAGLRVGFVYCLNEALFEKLVAAAEVDATIGGVSSLSQIAAIACLEKGAPRLKEFVRQMEQNRDYALGRLNAMPGVRCHKPQATFVLLPDIRATGLDAQTLVGRLRDEYGVALVPGGERFFGPGSEGYVRICLATSHEVLEEGLNRMERGLRAIMAETR